MIDIWNAELIADPGAVERAERLLDANERERAARFATQTLRDTYVLAHGVLHALLARHAAGALEIVAGEHGKPRLAGGGIEFNLTHSGTFAGYAFGETELGIDIERMRPLHDLEMLARRSFSAEEYEELLTVEGEARVDAFYACWTRKEAFIKATGRGLAYGLKKFRVSLLPGHEPRVLRVDGGDADEWQLHALEVAPGYAGALAYRGARRELRISRMTAAAILRKD